MYQLVDMTRLLDKITKMLNIKLLMICTIINKFYYLLMLIIMLII